MTEQELKDIVSAVVAELEKSGVDFDYKAEQAKDDDLVFVIRGTAPNYQGMTVTWKGLLDIITAQATQAKTDAVNAKDIAQQILTQVQSKGTEITNFVATSKAEIETQKNESVNAVKSVYQTDLNELKGDLTNLDENIFDVKTTVISAKNGRNSYKFIKGKKYKLNITATGISQLQVGTIDESSNYIDSTPVITESDVNYNFDFYANDDSNYLYVYVVPNTLNVSITVNDYSEIAFIEKQQYEKDKIKRNYSVLIQNDFTVDDYHTNGWVQEGSTVSENGLQMPNGSNAHHLTPFTIDDYIVTARFKVLDATSKFSIGNLGGWMSKAEVDCENNCINIYTNVNDGQTFGIAKTVQLNSNILVNGWYILELMRDGWDYVFRVIRQETNTIIGETSFSNYDGITTRIYSRFNGYNAIWCDNGNVICNDFTMRVNNKHCRCLIIGDSLTEGDQVENSARWARRLKYEYFNGDAIVAGCGGDSTTAMATKLQKYIDSGITFDYCIILGGMNNRAEGYFDKYKTDMETIINLVKSQNAIPIICINPIPQSGADYIHEQRYYAVSTKGWNVVRFDTAFNSSASYQASLFNSDGIHPNADGNTVMFNTIVSYLEKTIVY